MPARARAQSRQSVRAQPPHRLLPALARQAARRGGVRDLFAIARAGQARHGEILVRSAGEVTLVARKHCGSSSPPLGYFASAAWAAASRAIGMRNGEQLT